MKLYIAIVCVIINFHAKIYSQDFNKLQIFTENNPPYVTLDTNNKISGEIGNQVVKILKKLNISPNKINVFPWARAYVEAAKGKNTLIFPLVKTKDRMKIFQYPILAFKQNFNFYKLKSSKNINLKSIEDAKKYSTCVVRHDARHDYLLGFNFKNLEITTEQTTNVQKFVNNRCDLIIETDEGIDAKLKELKSDKSIVEIAIEAKQFDGNLYIAFNLNTDPKIVDAFKKASK
ncbi:transporter substrate-binding domain-containing protein [Silvanigrella paludirubra]|uniref:Transporter substrate-binding domain-containing protein n=1 Tax=Silvanigrella paludirubra TaxID=2499159 RepID=A0A6N6VYG4_9BACT|nr:transporter substrate-binding domain-containing protein [Silvanigrella paludirubra]KAB8040827.1 transporter substrate-binding domain-containing protein [Silvanigrella paludirubra]